MKYEQPSGKLLDKCIENILFTTTTATTKTPNKKTLKKPLPNRKTFPFFLFCYIKFNFFFLDGSVLYRRDFFKYLSKKPISQTPTQPPNPQKIPNKLLKVY